MYISTGGVLEQIELRDHSVPSFLAVKVPRRKAILAPSRRKPSGLRMDWTLTAEGQRRARAEICSLRTKMLESRAEGYVKTHT